MNGHGEVHAATTGAIVGEHSPTSISARRCPRTATVTSSAARVPAEPAFSEQERLALAGFLADYRGLTRESYALDLRHCAGWCQLHNVRLFRGAAGPPWPRARREA